MLDKVNGQDLWVSIYTLLLAAAGAAVAYVLNVPVYILVGPALAVSLAGLSGRRFAVDDRIRDAAFIFLGIGIGAGITPEAMGAFLRWPLAFAVLAVLLVAIMVVSSLVLARGFGYDARSATLASAPGHLSFVISMAASLNLDVARISIAQSVRLLALTLCVPAIAAAFGVDASARILPPGENMGALIIVGLWLASLGFGLILQRLRMPAPLLMGGLILSGICHATGIVPQVLPEPIALASFLVLGALIGTRFSGVSVTALRSAALAGVATTAVAVFFAALGAVPVAWALDMAPEHVLVAFAPGGLETMIAMGLALGANPGFVAACHVARLLILSGLVPVFMGRADAAQGQS
ncbi:MAG: AbrB family transcriptional regulator [Pseudomonadota bacterium]